MLLKATKLSGRDLGGIPVPSCKGDALSGIIDTIRQHVV